MPNDSANLHTVLHKINVYANRKAAEGFLNKNKIKTEGTPILVPFKKDNEIQFLKPQDKGDCIRIIGAANLSEREGVLSQIKQIQSKVPHLNKLEGESILLEENSIIIIYQRAKKKLRAPRIGTEIMHIFENGKIQAKLAQDQSRGNNQIRVNIAFVTTELANQTLNSGIVAGIAYFIAEGELYRYIFKKGVANRDLQDYLRQEAEVDPPPVPMKMDHDIKRETNDLAFARDCVRWIFLAMSMGVVAGGVAGVILSPLAGISFAFAIFVGVSIWGFDKASKANTARPVYGSTKFIPISLPEVTTPSDRRQRAQGQPRSDTMVRHSASQMNMAASIIPFVPSQRSVTTTVSSFFTQAPRVAMFLANQLCSQSNGMSSTMRRITHGFL